MLNLITFIIVMTLFQVGILFMLWMRRRNPLLLLPRNERTQAMIELMKVRNHLESIGVFAGVLLGKNYGKINLSQMEFINQIREASHIAMAKVNKIIGGTKGHLTSGLLNPILETVSQKEVSKLTKISENPIVGRLEEELKEEGGEKGGEEAKGESNEAK